MLWFNKKYSIKTHSRLAHFYNKNYIYLDGNTYEGVPNEWTPDVIPSETYIHHTLQRSLQIPQILSPVVTPSLKLMTMGTPSYYLEECGTTEKNQKLLNSSDLIENSTKLNNTIHSNHYQQYNSLKLNQLNEQNNFYKNSSPQKQPYHYYQSTTLKKNFVTGNLSQYANHSSTDCYNTIDRKHTIKNNIKTHGSTLTLNRSNKYLNGENIIKENVLKNGTLKFGNTIDDEMNDAYYTYTAKKTRPPPTTFN